VSNPSPGNVASFWSSLLDLNKTADALIARAQKAADVSQPIGRETPFWASIEVRYANIGTVNSDAVSGNSIKRESYNNGGSRIFIREMTIQAYSTTSAAAFAQIRVPAELAPFAPNYRWNFYTSITERRYATERCLAYSAGKAKAGNHLAFREPLIVEPRESLVFECELMGSRDMQAIIVTMDVSGYREGI